MKTKTEYSQAAAGVLPNESEASSDLAGIIRSQNLRNGASGLGQVLLMALLGIWACALLGFLGNAGEWMLHRVLLLFALTGIGCWRWGWFFLQNVRAVLYRYVVFPRIRRQADAAVVAHGPVPEVIVMATTYREKPWITRAVFESIFQGISSIEGLVKAPKVVVATGCDEDDDTIRSLYAEHCQALEERGGSVWKPELVLLRADNGKRAAIAASLRNIVEGSPLPDSAVVFLDGDTILQPGFFQKVLPLFRIDPKVSAVTTNEDGYVRGTGWFAEWISMRFGLRHRTMCSIALSGKLLCLTGRLSVFRGSVACDPTFMAQIEHDSIHHWLWGTFEMLSGDDKSTWFWLARHGARMLYVPDAKVTTIEVVNGTGVERAIANIRRWSGNSLRHSWRAIRLGPRQLGWFPWWSLIDQRMAMFTVLFGPLVAVLSLFAGRPEVAASYGLWVICSRVIHASICWRHSRRFSIYYIPLVFISDWAVALTKIWVLFHPAKQSWLNRGARTLDSTRQSKAFKLQSGVAHYIYGFTCAATVSTVALVAGFLPLATEARLFLGNGGAASGLPTDTAQAAPAERVMFGGLAAALPKQSAALRDGRLEGLTVITNQPEAPKWPQGAVAILTPGQ
jgi:mannuronan synthase